MLAPDLHSVALSAFDGRIKLGIHTHTHKQHTRNGKENSGFVSEVSACEKSNKHTHTHAPHTHTPKGSPKNFLLRGDCSREGCGKRRHSFEKIY
jgi:hypothetical protein